MPTFESFVQGIGKANPLKLGQGFRGRLPSGGGPAPLRPLPGIPHIQGPKLPNINYGAVAQVGRQPRPDPFVAPRPQRPDIDPLRPPNLLQETIHTAFPQGLPSTKQMKLNATEQRAMKLINNPWSYQKADPKINKLIFNPTPALQSHINNVPHAAENHQYLQNQIKDPGSFLNMGTPAGAKRLAQQSAKETQAAATTGFGQANAAGFGVLGLGPASGWLNRLGTGVSQDLQAAGPGMIATGVGMYHHPLGTSEGLVKNIAKGLYTTVRHPVYSFWDHPDQGLMNALTIASAGAGTAARVGEVGDAMSALKAGEITPLQAVRRVAATPRFERNVSVVPGGRIRATPPAFRSTIGGLLQTKLVDPLTEKAINMREAATPDLATKLQFKGRTLPVTQDLKNLAAKIAEGHNAKFLRRDIEMKTEMGRGAVEQKLIAQAEKQGLPLTKQLAGEIQQQAYAIGAMQTHHDLWKSLSDGGASANESLHLDPNGFVGIKEPPSGPFGIKEANKFSSARAIARMRNGMAEYDPEKMLANPDAYRYIPKAVWNKLKLQVPEWGPETKILNAIDAGNQAVRAGRFIHPGYAAWGVQNGLLHLSQAGGFVIRNVHQLRNEFPELSAADKAMFDNSVGAGHFGGGIARATAGGEESLFKGTTKAMARFWHGVDDKIPRRLSLIHELNREGYHSAEDWSNLMHTDPRKFRSIALNAQKHAIDYAEMSPAERATVAKLMTAYGWTRGASTYAMRFPLEHPAQATAINAMAQKGKADVNNFYSGYNGMVPSWLRGYLPIGHGNHPALINSTDINPGGTLGDLMQSMPWLVKGPHDPLVTQLGPAAGFLNELATGRDPYGKAIPGSQQFSKPLSDMLRRANPIGEFNMLTSSKHGGGTFTQGPAAAAESFFGVPLSHLANPKTTAGLGMKDYEQSLAPPEAVRFRTNLAIQNLPKEAALLKKRGAGTMSPHQIAQVRGDLEAKQMQDLWMLKYASDHGANSFKSLPAMNKYEAALNFLVHIHHMSPQQAATNLTAAKQIKDDSILNTMATAEWDATGIGTISKAWADTVKAVQPQTLTPAR